MDKNIISNVRYPLGNFLNDIVTKSLRILKNMKVLSIARLTFHVALYVDSLSKLRIAFRFRKNSDKERINEDIEIIDPP